MLQVELDDGAVFALENVIAVVAEHGEERVLDVDVFHHSFSVCDFNRFWG